MPASSSGVSSCHSVGPAAVELRRIRLGRRVRSPPPSGPSSRAAPAARHAIAIVRLATLRTLPRSMNGTSNSASIASPGSTTLRRLRAALRRTSASGTETGNTIRDGGCKWYRSGRRAVSSGTRTVTAMANSTANADEDRHRILEDLLRIELLLGSAVVARRGRDAVLAHQVYVNAISSVVIGGSSSTCSA